MNLPKVRCFCRKARRWTALCRAVADALPEGTTLGFSSDGDERTWMHAIGPGDSSDPVVTREVLNTALASLNRCTLGGYGDGQEGAPLQWVSQ